MFEMCIFYEMFKKYCAHFFIMHYAFQFVMHDIKKFTLSYLKSVFFYYLQNSKFRKQEKYEIVNDF